MVEISKAEAVEIVRKTSQIAFPNDENHRKFLEFMFYRKSNNNWFDETEKLITPIWSDCTYITVKYWDERKTYKITDL